MSDKLLECRDVLSYYGESYILQGVSVSVMKGELLALLGRNGAGKTTLLRSIAGARPPTVRRGSIRLRGEEVTRLPPFEIARRGVSFVPEDRRIVPGLTVEENLRLAQVDGSVGWSVEHIFERFPRLSERRRQQGQTLSGGEQQMLAIARALARNTSLILLDEPYEGLAPQIVREVERILLEIKAAGITTLLVEQNAAAALKIADRCYIIDDGRVVHEATPDELRADEATRRRYLAV